MAIRPIILLGNPILRETCRSVRDVRTRAIRGICRDLQDTLENFQRRKGFGRGIAAPQIGSTDRIIFIRMEEFTGPMINPVVVRKSRNTFELWDDCFSFPDLLVRVRRRRTIEVRFRDAQGTSRALKAAGALSELLQHEIDHLDGVLAIDRAIDSRHIVLRSEFDKLQRTRKQAL